MNKYTRMNWENTPSTATPLNADNLNHMDEGIEQVTDGVIALETEITTARGTQPNLNERFVANETNLENKANTADVETVKSEIINARGDSETLGERLDNLLPDEVDVITTDHMRDGSVKASKIANDAITTDKIIAKAVTANKLSLELLALINSIVNKADTADVDTALAKKADKATTLDGYDITDAYTKSTVKSLLADKLDLRPFDSEPTLNSPCYLTSGAVYSALTKKFDNSNIETGKGNLSPAQAIYDGYEGNFNYVKIGKIVTVALNITTLIAGKNYVQFSGLPFRAMTASKLSSIAVYTTNNKLVNLRLDGSWLYISSPGTTFADGEQINAIITYIIG